DDSAIRDREWRRRKGESYFFQAEDGIRGRNVTGVQTCALPISVRDALARAILEQQGACVQAHPIAHGAATLGTVAGESHTGRRRSEERRVGKECRSRGAWEH